ncbi:MAG: aminoglycoside 3'-phosphotransferase [Candidatus Bathyarchaeota archaeon]|nr:aminoglycoside 3'-phosphotransferase [Candidatus Bathyarchaeota archaeon]
MGEGLSTRLPNELAERLTGYSLVKHPYDESQATIYVLTHQTEPRLYLKIRGDQTNRLSSEYRMLKWINQRVPTPEPLYYTKEASTEYLLTTEIKGTPTYQVEPSERETAVRILAKTLRKIHSLDTVGCPVRHTVDDWIKALREKEINVSPLGDWRPLENLCFTHGDYCLPNIIVENGVLSGVIDWDYAGLADPYVDLASCTWSLGYNYKEEAETLIPLFLETYGVDIDEAKLGFYRSLYDLIP